MKFLILLQVVALLLVPSFGAWQPRPSVAGVEILLESNTSGVANSVPDARFDESSLADQFTTSMPTEFSGNKESPANSLPSLPLVNQFSTSSQLSMEKRSRVWPIESEVTRAYEPPAVNWLPGHRGIDLAAEPGETVRTPEEGIVSWIGTIDGVPMMTVTHRGGIRTTYQPVETLLSIGDRVIGEEAIGSVAELPESAAYEHVGLHFGVKRGEQYLDPLIWLAGNPLSPIRLFGIHDVGLKT